MDVPTNTTATLTPTSYRMITQLLESDDCLTNLQTMDDDRGFVPPAIPSTMSSDGKTYVNLDSKAWGGGTTTVVTPTSNVAPSELPTTIITTIPDSRTPSPIPANRKSCPTY